MVVISSFPPPTEGVKLRQPETTAVMNTRELGKGTIYIAESRLSWVDDSTGRGFSLEYPHISIHAVSRDVQTYPKECLYVMVDTNIDFEDARTGDAGSSDEEEDDITELRFIPDDKAVLDTMFTAMSDCQALHPDSQQSNSECEDDEEDDEDDNVYLDADSDCLNTNGVQDFGMEVEGQFDDAEDDPGFQEN